MSVRWPRAVTMGMPPVVAPYMVLLLFVMFFIFALIFVSAAGMAFETLGIPRQYLGLVLVSSLVGGMINIPVARVTSEVERMTLRPSLFGGLYPMPSVEKVVQETRIAVNLGGAIIPILMCVYIVAMVPRAIIGFVAATAMVTILCNALARPIPGIGISIPVLIPPIAAAASAYVVTQILGYSISTAAAIAYVSGVMGVLMGADLLNLGKIRKLGAPTVSIGGAGTFDGIFLTGILSVILFPAR